MPSLDATVGGTSANSYLTVADAGTLADERLRTSAWDGEGEDDQQRALIMATRRLDALEYEGDKSDSSQALKWPRQDVIDDNGDEYATDAIPDLIKQQTFEIALWLLREDDDGTDPLANDGLERYDMAKVGPLEVEPNHSRRAGALPDHVLRALRPVRKSAGLMAELVRA